MTFKTMSNALTSRVGRRILTVQKHSPRSLFVVGVVGFAATIVLSCRATLKLDAILDASDKEIAEADREMLTETPTQSVAAIRLRTAGKIAWLYTPAVGTAILSVAALTGSHVILSRRNVALTAAYSGLDKAYKAYRQKVIETIGEEQERELRFSPESIEKKTINEKGEEVTTTEKVVNPGKYSPYARCFDAFSKRWSRTPEYNQMFLNSQQNWMNDLLRANGHVFLNEVYDALGFERTKEGQIVGWVLNNPEGDNMIDFGIFKDLNDARRFINGYEDSIYLDFNVDGNILALI